MTPFSCLFWASAGEVTVCLLSAAAIRGCRATSISRRSPEARNFTTPVLVTSSFFRRRHTFTSNFLLVILRQASRHIEPSIVRKNSELITGTFPKFRDDIIKIWCWVVVNTVPFRSKFSLFFEVSSDWSFTGICWWSPVDGCT